MSLNVANGVGVSCKVAGLNPDKMLARCSRGELDKMGTLINKLAVDNNLPTRGAVGIRIDSFNHGRPNSQSLKDMQSLLHKEYKLSPRIRVKAFVKQQLEALENYGRLLAKGAEFFNLSIK